MISFLLYANASTELFSKLETTRVNVEADSEENQQ